MEGDIAQHRHVGLVRTDMHCTNCSKAFVCEIDHGINGEFKINCPHCDHQHWRVVIDGVMTERRWGEGDNGQQRTLLVRTWVHPKLEAKTTRTCDFIRHRWLNRER